MNEKTKLLDLFQAVKRSIDLAQEKLSDIQTDYKLSSQGKEEDITENKGLFAEAMQQYQKEMLDIVDSREADYTALNVKSTKDRLKDADYMRTLIVNLDAIKQGIMGKIEVMALIDAYKDNDHAMGMITDTLLEMHSPYVDLLPDRVTVKMQLNAFESIRNIIRSKINGSLLDVPARYTTVETAYSFYGSDKMKDSKYAYFGAGLMAIENELNEDLTLKDASATLGKINNALDTTSNTAKNNNTKDAIAINAVSSRRKREREKAAMKRATKPSSMR